ncbi:MAG: hypothetical protein ACREJQ_00260 [bacterium]
MISGRGETVSDTLFAAGVGLAVTLLSLKVFRHGMPFVLGVLAFFLYEGFHIQFEFHLVLFFAALVIIAAFVRFTPEPIKTWGPPFVMAVLAAYEGGQPLPISAIFLAAFGYAYLYSRSASGESGTRRIRLEDETLLLGLVLALTFIAAPQDAIYLYLMYTAPLVGFLLFARQPAAWVVISVMYTNLVFLARAVH